MHYLVRSQITCQAVSDRPHTAAVRRKPPYWERNMTQCHFFQLKFQTDWLRTQPEPPT